MNCAGLSSSLSGEGRIWFNFLRSEDHFSSKEIWIGTIYGDSASKVVATASKVNNAGKVEAIPGIWSIDESLLRNSLRYGSVIIDNGFCTRILEDNEGKYLVTLL